MPALSALVAEGEELVRHLRRAGQLARAREAEQEQIQDQALGRGGERGEGRRRMRGWVRPSKSKSRIRPWGRGERSGR